MARLVHGRQASSQLVHGQERHVDERLFVQDALFSEDAHEPEGCARVFVADHGVDFGLAEGGGEGGEGDGPAGWRGGGAWVVG